MIKQLKLFANCVLAGVAAGFFGLLFGFYDYAGGVYYDINGGLFMAACFFLAAFVACLVDAIKQYNNNNNE